MATIGRRVENSKKTKKINIDYPSAKSENIDEKLDIVRDIVSKV